MTDTNVTQLIINKLTKAQYDALQDKSETELYLVPDEIDDTPTLGSTNPVTSDGIKVAINGKVSKSGDTMTGNLNMADHELQVRANRNGIKYVDASTGILIGNGNMNMTIQSGDADLKHRKGTVNYAILDRSNVKTINGQDVYGTGNINIYDVFVVEYGVTTYPQVLNAYTAGKHLILKYNINENSDDWRFLPLEDVVISRDGASAGTYIFTFSAIYNNYSFLCNIDIYGYSQTTTNLQQKLTFDNTPTANSDNPVTSSGIKTALDNKQNKIDSTHKLSADFVDDSTTTHKFVTTNEKETWNNKADVVDGKVQAMGLEVLDNSSIVDMISVHMYGDYPTPVFVANTLGNVIVIGNDGLDDINFAWHERNFVSIVTLERQGKLAETAYQKPQGGIPESDIANGVIPDVSQFITKSVNDLVNYYTKSETYTQSEVNALIGAIQQFHYDIYASLQDITTPATNVLYLIGPTGSGNDKYEEYVYANSDFQKIGDTSIDLSNYVTTQALNTALANYVTSTDLTTLLSGKQDTLVSGTNIKTINNQNILGSGNVDVQPTIDSSHKLSADLVDDTNTAHKFITSAERTLWNTVTEKAPLPFVVICGIDPSDESFVRSTLDEIWEAHRTGKVIRVNFSKAGGVSFEDDATLLLDGSRNCVAHTVHNGTHYIVTIYDDNGTTKLSYAETHDSDKQDTLVSGTNIKSINNESILGAGNVNFAKYEDTLISSDAITCETEETVGGVSVYSSTADYYLQPNQKIVFADIIGNNTLYIINYDDINNPFIISSGKGSISWNNFTNNDVRIQLASSSNTGQTLSASRYWRGTDNVFIVEYGVTTVQEIQDALNTGKIIVCHRIESNEAVYYQLSVNSSQYFRFYCMVGPTCYVMNLRKSDNMWSVSTGPLEQTTNKATDFTTLNNTKYPTTKAVADYVNDIVGNINSILETI